MAGVPGNRGKKNEKEYFSLFPHVSSGISRGAGMGRGRKGGREGGRGGREMGGEKRGAEARAAPLHFLGAGSLIR